MPKSTSGSNVGKYPVKIGPGDTRLVDAKFGPQGQVKILPPKRAPAPKPIVNTTVPNPRILNSVAQISRTLVLKGAKPGDPEPYVFGRAPVRPLVIAADDSGEYLVLDLLWSVGPVQRVCNGIVPSTASSGTWDYYLWPPDLGAINVAPGALHEHFLGTQSQAASTIMTALKGSYPAYPGLAHSVISMQLGWNLNIVAYMDGVEVLDPRISPQSAWTENPALILADVLTRCGYTMNWTSVGEAADYCDEGVDIGYSPLNPRWQIGGVINTRQELQATVFSLAQYASCYVDVRGGEVILVPDMPRASNHTVTADDMLEGSVRLSRRAARDVPSKVTINFLAPDLSWFNASFGTSDGSGTETTLQMPWWDQHLHAGRKAEEIFNKSQHDLESLEFTRFDDGLIRTLGDVGTITNAAVGLTAQTMALVENEPVARGRWRCKYVPYSAADYVAAFNADYGGASGTVNNPYSPPAGPTPTLTAELVTSTSPNYYRIKIDFSPVTWAYLQDYKVNVYIDGVSPITILHSEYVPRYSETGSPLTITVYADLNDSPGFQMSIGNSPQTVYRVDVYCRSLWVDQEGDEILSTTPGTATVTDPVVDDPCIVWGDSAPFTSTVHDPGGAYNNIYFYEGATGKTSPPYHSSVGYWIDASTIGIDSAIHDNCTTFTTGQFLVKYDVVTDVTGHASEITLNYVTGREGVWVDLFRANIELDATGSPLSYREVVIDITIASVDGNSPQGPAAGAVTKRITLISDSRP